MLPYVQTPFSIPFLNVSLHYLSPPYYRIYKFHLLFLSLALPYIALVSHATFYTNSIFYSTIPFSHVILCYSSPSSMPFSNVILYYLSFPWFTLYTNSIFCSFLSSYITLVLPATFHTNSIFYSFL